MPYIRRTLQGVLQGVQDALQHLREVPKGLRGPGQGRPGLGEGLQDGLHAFSSLMECLGGLPVRHRVAAIGEPWLAVRHKMAAMIDRFEIDVYVNRLSGVNLLDA